MKKIFVSITIIVFLASCSNSSNIETGEIRTLQLLKDTFGKSNKPKQYIDARNLLNRKQIDAAKMPVLFVELPSGQNGTLTPYPGQGIGQTWLGADGATITLEKGILKASRGMGDDLMGSFSFIPIWSKIEDKTETYRRELSHITGNNTIVKRVFKCETQKTSKNKSIKIWDVKFITTKFEENCINNRFAIKNIYYVDPKGIVRRSRQYHSDTVGSLFIERLDR